MKEVVTSSISLASNLDLFRLIRALIYEFERSRNIILKDINMPSDVVSIIAKLTERAVFQPSIHFQFMSLKLQCFF